MGRYDRALADYATALQMRPDYPYALLNRGRVYHQQGKYELAINDYSRTIAQRPNYDSAYYSRGLTYRKLHMTDEAIADFIACYNVTKDADWREAAMKQLRELGFQP